MKDLKELFGKILLPLVTPYKTDETVDFSKYSELIEYLLANNMCDSFIVSGTTGEASLLTFDERSQLFKTAAETIKGRKPVIAGTGCASTRETIMLTEKALEAGIDTMLIVCPFYNKPTQEGLYLHYKTIASATPAKILLYNIPIFTGVNLEPETVRKLSKIDNIIGIKDEAGMNPTQITDYFLITSEREDFLIYNGDDVMLLPTIIQGAIGIVSGGAHIFGREIREIFENFETGEFKYARKLFNDLYSFCKICGSGGRILPNPIMRPAIELVTGISIGPGRMPLSPITTDEMAILRAGLQKLGKI